MKETNYEFILYIIFASKYKINLHNTIYRPIHEVKIW